MVDYNIPVSSLCNTRKDCPLGDDEFRHECRQYSKYDVGIIEKKNLPFAADWLDIFAIAHVFTKI